MSKSGDYNLSEIEKRDELIQELVEVLAYWLPFIQGQEGKSDASDIMVDKAVAAIAKAEGK